MDFDEFLDILYNKTDAVLIQFDPVSSIMLLFYNLSWYFVKTELFWLIRTCKLVLHV